VNKLPIGGESSDTCVAAKFYIYMTSGDKSGTRKIRTAGLLTEDFTYDAESRIIENKQTVAYRDNYPMTVNYLYDTLDRIKEVHYPGQYGPLGGVRKIVEHTYDTASRLTRLRYGTTASMIQQAGDIVYNASDQTTSVNIGTPDANQVNEQYTFDQQTGLLTNQKVIRGTSNRNTRPSLALANYAGTYADKLYGNVVVSQENGKLLLKFGPAPNFVADLEHWNYDTFQIKWRPSVAYNFPRGFVTFTVDKNGKTDELKIDQPNNDFWFYELAPRRIK